MQAAWYERRGAARDVLVVGSMPDPNPGAGEVRLRLSFSGMSAGDIKKRTGWQGSPMSYPRVIPHSDGAGMIDAVGAGVDPERMGHPAWCFGAQSYRPFGTAAQYVVVPDALAVSLPANTTSALLEHAACLGIPGITGWRAVFADGPVTGLTVLIWGAASGVGAVALQMAVRDGATVLAVVRKPEQQEVVLSMGATAALLADAPDLVDAIRRHAPEGVHRVADVDFGGNIAVNAQILDIGGVISAYYSSQEKPTIPYWSLGFADATLRLLGSDDFPTVVKIRAAHELTAALMEGKLKATVTARFPLERIAEAHDLVEQGTGGRVVLAIDQPH